MVGRGKGERRLGKGLLQPGRENGGQPGTQAGQRQKRGRKGHHQQRLVAQGVFPGQDETQADEGQKQARAVKRHSHGLFSVFTHTEGVLCCSERC